MRVGSAVVVTRVELDDSRVLIASPGHPTSDGRRIGDLRAGDHLDGATVVSVNSVRYEGGETFDLLPASPTGGYWADGVLLGSTLTPLPARSRE